MRKILFILLFILGLSINPTFSSADFFSINLNWQLGIRFGFEHHFSSQVGFKADAGLAVPGIITADGFILFYTHCLNEKWQISICPGISNILIPIGANAGMISPGVSIMIRHRLSKKMNLEFRFGEGFPLFFESRKKVIRDINMPFGLWPDLSIGISWKF